MKRATIDKRAGELLRNPKVAARVTQIRAEHRKRHDVTVDRILDELACIGFANMRDYLELTEDGVARVDLSTLTRDQAAAINEVNVEVYMEGKGEDAQPVKRIKFKLHDKRAALVDMGRHLGMFKEVHEHTGKNGGPIETADRHTILEQARRIAFALSRAREYIDDDTTSPAH
jgi:phage terminase small subunit